MSRINNTLFLLFTILLVDSSLGKIGDHKPFCLVSGDTFSHTLKSLKKDDVDPKKLQGTYRMIVNFLPEVGTFCSFRDVKLTYNPTDDHIDFEEVCWKRNDRLNKVLVEGLTSTKVTTGKLTPGKTSGFAKMSMEYGILPLQKKNKWILERSEDYKFLLIGEPCMEHVFLYAREDDGVEVEAYDQERRKIIKNYEVKAFIKTAVQMGFEFVEQGDIDHALIRYTRIDTSVSIS